MIRETLTEAVFKALKTLELEAGDFVLEHPTDITHGDYATNVALIATKDGSKNPRVFAEVMVAELSKDLPKEVERVEIAGPGFINFFLTKSFFADSIEAVVTNSSTWGRNNSLEGKKVVVEYTDPNPFKVMHIGHVMTNTIGEAIARLHMFSGAEVRRVNYQGDVGMHVATALWGVMQMGTGSLTAEELGQAYARGTVAFKENEKVKEEIISLNKKIYDRTDEEINKLYDEGRQISLDEFETVYARLGTTFDSYYFESRAGVPGKEAVEKGLQEGVFEKSEGAVVFKGEQYGLHTRVFLNAQGLPTYEAKELGLAKVKYDDFPYDLSIIVTANEINDYFKVLLRAMTFVFPALAERTVHVSHGFLKLTSGKMSSRAGTIVAAKTLLNDLQTRSRERIDDAAIADQVGVAAVKYGILKQTIHKDIVFDEEKALSLEGDSGPYLQYSHVRALSILKKATDEGVISSIQTMPEDLTVLARVLHRFPEVVARAQTEREPHHVTTYLTELAGAFNSWYAREKIVERGDSTSSYKVALTEAFATTMKNGLWLLGIQAPEKM